jgi:hypothetical protein
MHGRGLNRKELLPIFIGSVLHLHNDELQSPQAIPHVKVAICFESASTLSEKQLSGLAFNI